MNNKAMIGWMLAGALGIASASPAAAQSTIGGAKTQQNKIGGVAKPPPVIGGATHTPAPLPPKPAPVVGIAKPASPGTATPGAAGAATPALTARSLRPNPPVTPPNKGGTVVTSNLKCASGACSTGAPKP